MSKAKQLAEGVKQGGVTLIIDIAKQPQWVICTPTKCGTNSVQKLLIEDLGIGKLIEPHHRCDVPDELGEIPVRIMLDRAPVDRWCSIYHHQHRLWKSGDNHTPSLIGSARDPETFARYYFRCIDQPDPLYKKTYIWHYHRNEIAKIFDPMYCIRLVEFPDSLEVLGSAIGRTLPALPYENRGGRPDNENILDRLSDQMTERLTRWAYQPLET